MSQGDVGDDVFALYTDVTIVLPLLQRLFDACGRIKVCLLTSFFFSEQGRQNGRERRHFVLEMVIFCILCELGC